MKSRLMWLAMSLAMIGAVVAGKLTPVQATAHPSVLTEVHHPSLLRATGLHADLGNTTQIRVVRTLSGLHCDPSKGEKVILYSGGVASEYYCSATDTWTQLIGSTPGGGQAVAQPSGTSLITSNLNKVVNPTACQQSPRPSWCPAAGATADLGDMVNAALNELPTSTLPTGVTVKGGKVTISAGTYGVDAYGSNVVPFTHPIILSHYNHVSCEGFAVLNYSGTGAAFVIADSTNTTPANNGTPTIDGNCRLNYTGTLVQNSNVTTVNCTGSNPATCTFTSSTNFTGFNVGDQVMFDNFVSTPTKDQFIQHNRGVISSVSGTTMVVPLNLVSSTGGDVTETNGVITVENDGVWLGGDQTGKNATVNAWGQSVTFSGLQIRGFYCGMSFGNNNWGSQMLGGEINGSTGANVCFNQDGFNRSESDVFVGVNIHDGNWGVWNDGNGELWFIGSRCDYNQKLVAGVYTGGCVESFNGITYWIGSHLEENAGAYFTTTGNLKPQMYVMGGMMYLNNSSYVGDNAIAVLHAQGAIFSMEGVKYNWNHPVAAWVDNSVGNNNCFNLGDTNFKIGLEPATYFTSTAHNMQVGCTTAFKGANVNVWRTPYNINNVRTNNIGTSTPIFSVTQAGNAGISNVSLTSNVVTITATNQFSVGNTVLISGLSVGADTDLNGQTLTIASASGTQFTANFTHADIASQADSGFATKTSNLDVMWAFGVNPSNTNDSLDTAFHFAGAGSSSNYATLGLHGNSAPLKITPTAVQLPLVTNSPVLATDGSGNIVAGTPVSPNVAQAGGDLACAMAGDTTIGAQTVTAGSSTASTMTYTMASVPNYIYAGSVIGAAGNTPSGYNGGGFTVTSVTSTTVTVTSANNPGTLTVGGTIYLWCGNQSTDALTTSFYSANNTYTVAANYFLTAGATLQQQAMMSFWSSSAAPGLQIGLVRGATTMISPAGNMVMINSMTGNKSGLIGFQLTGISSTLVNADITQFSGPTSSTVSLWSPSITNPATFTAGSTTLFPKFGFVATGVASGTYTSGGSITGTVGQTCTLTSFNNSSTATATVTLTGTNTIAGGTALTITSRGQSATAAPTTATLGNGTATCSGTATISTVLGGAQGNAILIRAVVTRTY